MHLVGRPSDDRRSFGYHRSTILAAQANAAALLVVTALIVYEAIDRLLHPAGDRRRSGHRGRASSATVINLLAARVLDDHSHDLNMRGALLHMTSDALTSAGVAVAAIVIAVTGGNDWLDPAVSLVIALVHRASARCSCSAPTTSVLLESTPADVDPAELVAAMTAVAGVEAVHDLHTWSLSSDYRALSAHVVLEGEPSLAAGATHHRRGEADGRDAVRHLAHDARARGPPCAPDELDPCRAEPRVGVVALAADRGRRGDHRQDHEHHGHASVQHHDVHEPHEALTTDDGDQRDRPEREHGAQTRPRAPSGSARRGWR